MNKLTVTLKQHTPLIHFQHGQEGATLRASEVKPKLDKFIFTKLGKGDYEAGKLFVENNHRNWLVGDGEHPALDYKMRFLADEFDRKVALKVSPDKNPQMYKTEPYPDLSNSLIMSNMGGRAQDEVLNFSFASKVALNISTLHEELVGEVKKYLFAFFSEQNFGNRTSKGFGSFLPTHFNGIEIDPPSILSDYYMTFHLLDVCSEVNAYKDIFRIINTAWKCLKRTPGRDGKDIRSVLCGANPSFSKIQDRIPSPIIFKPIIYKEKGYWDVYIYIFFDEAIITNALTRLGKKELRQRIKERWLNDSKSLEMILSSVSKLNIDGFEIE